MPERMRLIRHRANVIFQRENDSPHLNLDITESGSVGKLAVSEQFRRTYYERAEQELLTEGKIKPG